MRRTPLLSWTLAALALASLLLSCRRDAATPPQQPGVVTPYPGYTPAPQPGWTAPPATATSPQPTMPPAFGFFCATDQDLQCPFGRCLGGRCGGCATVSDCKPGTTCAPSPFGMVCVGGAAPAPPVTATPPATTSPPVPTQPPGSADAYAVARALCVQRTNEYRARVGAQAVTRQSAAEGCGDQQAGRDAASRQAHGAFGACGEMAQNECPGWPGTPEQVVDSCLKMMFDEGPGEGSAHGHYNNMTNRSYAGVSCGFYRTPDGSLWVVQDFFR